MDNGVITFREISQAIFHRNFPFSDETKSYEPDSPEMVKLNALYAVGPDCYWAGIANEDDLREFFLDNQTAIVEVLASLRERIESIPDDEKTDEKIQEFRRFRLSGYGFPDGPEKWPARDYWVLKNAHEWLQPLFPLSARRAHLKEIAQAEQTEQAEEPAAVGSAAAEQLDPVVKRAINKRVKSSNYPEAVFKVLEVIYRDESSQDETVNRLFERCGENVENRRCSALKRAWQEWRKAGGQRPQKKVKI
ncbi:hypothetical protein BIU88_09375 [Chlorobaculum limnaeum]|uniref:Uncharacterized protein n=1 Tax=Chlorobaculum limnaeum TaxID=274537 RepID=A0A1D8CZF3_CHLLM|nr:hypothetical protein [Chlorobaculum limnaeum]AOS84320.1 hypothetical protein BIU88_09375 [Chlorobaculum limnaeum]